ncbi:MAG: hypothetical protein OCD01_14505 [Fibrobacterales bacterium]
MKLLFALLLIFVIGCDDTSTTSEPNYDPDYLDGSTYLYITGGIFSYDPNDSANTFSQSFDTAYYDFHIDSLIITKYRSLSSPDSKCLAKTISYSYTIFNDSMTVNSNYHRYRNYCDSEFIEDYAIPNWTFHIEKMSYDTIIFTGYERSADTLIRQE